MSLLLAGCGGFHYKIDCGSRRLYNHNKIFCIIRLVHLKIYVFCYIPEYCMKLFIDMADIISVLQVMAMKQ